LFTNSFGGVMKVFMGNFASCSKNDSPKPILGHIYSSYNKNTWEMAHFYVLLLLLQQKHLGDASFFMCLQWLNFLSFYW
jgi:hypothetical protein